MRRGLLGCAALAVLAVVGLLVAAGQPITRRTFTLGAPNTVLLAVLRPTSRVCEGPIVSPNPVQSLGFWGAAGPSHRAQLTVSVQDAATNALLASVPVAAPPIQAQVTARLRRPVAAGLPLRICLTQDSGSLSLFGSGAVNPRVIMTGRRVGPQPTNGQGEEFSLDLFGTDSHSLLDSLGLAFSRASLWRPSWVGSWTFWVLAVALAGAFGLGVAATVTAAGTDEDPDQGVRDAEDGPPPPPDQTDESSRSRMVMR